MDDLYEIGDDGSVTLSVHAQPGAGKSEVVGRHGAAVKVRVAAPPRGGRANEALVELLATEFGLKPGQVSVTSGESSRLKRIRLVGLDPDDLVRQLRRLLPGGNLGPRDAVRDKRI